MAFTVAATVTLSSHQNASLFWIMLWLIGRPADHGMIRLIVAHAFFGHPAAASLLAWYDARDSNLESWSAYKIRVVSFCGTASHGGPYRLCVRLALRGGIDSTRRRSMPVSKKLWLRLGIAKPRTKTRISASVSEGQFSYLVFISSATRAHCGAHSTTGRHYCH